MKYKIVHIRFWGCSNYEARCLIIWTPPTTYSSSQQIWNSQWHILWTVDSTKIWNNMLTVTPNLLDLTEFLLVLSLRGFVINWNKYETSFYRWCTFYNKMIFTHLMAGRGPTFVAYCRALSFKPGRTLSKYWYSY